MLNRLFVTLISYHHSSSDSGLVMVLRNLRHGAMASGWRGVKSTSGLGGVSSNLRRSFVKEGVQERWL